MARTPVHTPVGRFQHLTEEDHTVVAALCGWSSDSKDFKIVVERAKQTEGFPMTRRHKLMAAALQTLRLNHFAETNGINLSNIFRRPETDQQNAA